MMKKINYRFNGLITIVIVYLFWGNILFASGLPIGLYSEEKTSSIDTHLQNLSQDNYNNAANSFKEINPSDLNPEELKSYVQRISDVSEYYHLQNNPDSTLYFCNIYNSISKEYSSMHFISECKLMYLKGWSLYKKANINEAREILKGALLSCTETDDSLKVLVLKYLGSADLIQRELRGASKYYRWSLELEESRENSSNVIVAGLNQNIGIVYAYEKKYDSARIFFLEAIQMKEKIMNPNDPVLANGYLNLSMFLWEIGELKEALYYINRAENIYRKNYGADYYDLAPLYLNKGVILYTLKDTPEALSYFNLANELNKKVKHPNVYEYTLYSNIGAAYGEMNDFESAIFYNKLALNYVPGPEMEVMILYNIASNYYGINDYVNAEQYYLTTIAKAKQLDFPSKAYANAFLSYARHLILTRRSSESLPFISNALEAFIKMYGEKNRKVCEAYTVKSSFYMIQGDYEIALRFAQKAIIASQKSFNDLSFYANPVSSQLKDDIALFDALKQKALLLFLINNNSKINIEQLRLSKETADLGIQVIENIKLSLKGENSKILLSTSSNDIYDLAVMIASKLYEETGDLVHLYESFKYAEKSKASALLANEREMEALQVVNIPQEIRTLEANLKSELVQYDNILYEENQNVNPDTNKIARIRLVSYKKGLEYDSLVKVLERDFPDYYNLKYNFESISVVEIQKRLTEKNALLEYKWIDSTLFTFIITKDSILIEQQNVGSNFSDKVQQFLSFINQLPEFTNVGQNSRDFAKLGHEIYETLELDHPLIQFKENLIIVPDGILGYLSFDALVCSKVDENHSGYKNLDYLVKRFAVSNGYSATLYFGDRYYSHTKDNVIAMAPAYENMSLALENSGPSKSREILEHLAPLQHTLQEVLNIGQILPGKILIDGNATESNFKVSCSEFKILHFAMHAVIDDNEPLSSKLIFDLEKNDTVEDGFLHTYEIYNLNLNAELAVLSACKTGTGRLSKGEGIMSLARGFLYAGVPGIVMTLWSIEDVSSAKIITNFYNFLKDGQEKDLALRNAKLEYLNNSNQLQSHPYFWAAYVQIGDNSALSNSNKFMYYLGGGLIVIALSIFIVLKRKKTHR